MMLIIVILALVSIMGVGYFITTLVFYLKKDENGNRLGIMKIIENMVGFQGLLLYLGIFSIPVLITLIVFAFLGIEI